MTALLIPYFALCVNSIRDVDSSSCVHDSTGLRLRFVLSIIIITECCKVNDFLCLFLCIFSLILDSYQRSPEVMWNYQKIAACPREMCQCDARAIRKNSWTIWEKKRGNFGLSFRKTLCWVLHSWTHVIYSKDCYDNNILICINRLSWSGFTTTKRKVSNFLL